MFAIRLYWNKD